MLTQLHIQNFKCWKDTGAIEMTPITLFFGTNSSGKSSIGQFLMMLKQTSENADRNIVFYPGKEEKDAVQLGSFQDMVYHHNVKNLIQFSYKWELEQNMNIKDPIDLKEFNGDALQFEAIIKQRSNKQPQPIVDYFRYQLLEGNQESLKVGMKRKSIKKSEYDIQAENYLLKRNTGRPWLPKKTVQFYGFPDEGVAYYQNAEFLKDINLAHKQLFESVFYLGPLRTKTKRLYSWSGEQPASVGVDGQETVAAFLSAKDRKIGIRIKENHRRATILPFDKLIAMELQRMGLIAEEKSEGFVVKNISGRQKEYEVKIKTKGSQDNVDLPDVGFGVSQVLPVLVQVFYAPANSIIIMEQPEIHLHPSAQSALADVMIDAINSRENGKDRNIQLIIETHSEHFLRRFQRRIAEGILPDSKIRAYFADVTKMPSRLEKLKVDEYGNIHNWPKDFFGDEMGDVIAHSKAAMERRSTNEQTE